MIKVSFIVPVYNTEKYLAKCLDSILNQTLKEIEVLVINDGTPDNSQEIIDQYAKKDNRIKPFIKENGGLSDARNYGIERAKGKYIWFIDSDDYLIKEDACEKFYNFALINDLDIAVADFIYDLANGKSILMKKDESLINKLYDGKTYLKESYKKKWDKKNVWLNLYKRSYIISNKYRFETGRYFEDIIWSPTTFVNAQRVMCIDDYFYFYRKNFQSITKSKLTEKKVADVLYVTKQLKLLCDSLNDRELRKLLYDNVVRNYLNSFVAFMKLKIDKNKYEKEISYENVECSKSIELRLALYKKNNVIYYYLIRIYRFLKVRILKK